MKEVLTPKEMQKVDLQTMKEFSLSSFELMKRVAKDMANEIARRFNKSQNILFLCGPGNNAGDAYCAAEFLRQWGYSVFLEEVLPPSSTEAKKAKQFCKLKASSGVDLKKIDILVDGIFGSSGKASLSADLKRRFKKWNSAKLYRISLDVPSGCDFGTPKAHPDAFCADLSLCVAYPKWGFLFEEVAEKLGEIVYVGGRFARPSHFKAYALEAEDFIFTNEKRTKHKTGKLCVVAGSADTPGAAFLAAEAGHRTGIGYVSLFSSMKKRFAIELKHASFMFKQNWKTADLKKFNSIVIGPGGCPKSFRFLEKLEIPQVIDADAISPVWQLKPYSKRIFTPHPGEAGRLLKLDASELQADRLDALDELARDRVVYLKGAPGLLKFPNDSQYYVNLSINPSLARAGSGDVLSGIMGGFLGQTKDFKRGVISSLVFQSAVSEELRGKRAAISSDQLEIFSNAFKRLTHAEHSNR